MGKNEIFDLIQQKERRNYEFGAELCCTYDQAIDEKTIRLFQITKATNESLSSTIYSIENVLDSLQEKDCDFIFLIKGENLHISYYYGICPRENIYRRDKENINGVLDHCEEVLFANLSANFPKMELKKLTHEEKNCLLKNIREKELVIQCEGVPGKVELREEAIGTERFKAVAMKESFIIVLQARPIHAVEKGQIAEHLQKMIEVTAELKDCTRTKNQSHTSETVASLSGNNSCLTSNSRSSMEQIAFQLFKAQGTVPTIDADTVRTIEQAFFASDIDDLDSLGDLYGELSRIRLNSANTNPVGSANERSNSQSEEPLFSPEGMQSNRENELGREESTDGTSNSSVQRPKQIFTGRNNFRNPFFNYWFLRNQQKRQREIMRDNNMVSIQSAEGSEKLESEAASSKQNESTVLENTEELVEPQGFSFTNLNKVDTISRTNTDSSTRTNQVTQTAKCNHVNTDAISYKVTNQGAKSWNTYLNDMVEDRLEYGYNRGMYLYTTTIYADKNVTLSKVSSAWRGMHRYSCLSRVPIKEVPVEHSSCLYQALVNFRLPLFYKKVANRTEAFSIDEIVANSAFSKFIQQPFLYGGNWISSKELSYLICIPSISKDEISEAFQNLKWELP